ncbi:MgtC/SapB family protein [Variovorax sp. MHTC-1]|uniref:MgtC/SapB family protein n=1 Tax=Variovorax sp. MHTC-1 TaxID=2495593 RepID=UPI000F86BE11|nr:MgtC/SapB family protein [Variovorax sp. MHTC-1]RST47786.1 MgtC/SapB family protein [Variovorax sp. MHTC-1]
MAIAPQHRSRSSGLRTFSLECVAGAVLMFVALGAAHSQPRKDVRDDWQLASPSEQRLDIKLLAELVDKLKSEELSAAW